jgi:hypothetical protein
MSQTTAGLLSSNKTRGKKWLGGKKPRQFVLSSENSLIATPYTEDDID